VLAYFPKHLVYITLGLQAAAHVLPSLFMVGESVSPRCSFLKIGVRNPAISIVVVICDSDNEERSSRFDLLNLGYPYRFDVVK